MLLEVENLLLFNIFMLQLWPLEVKRYRMGQLTVKMLTMSTFYWFVCLLSLCLLSSKWTLMPLLKRLQVVVERLDIREDTHGVWLVPHLHHVLHLDQTQTVGLFPETWNTIAGVSVGRWEGATANREPTLITVDGSDKKSELLLCGLTLQWRRPVPGCVCGQLCPASCSRTPVERMSEPEHRKPSHRSSWTRSSGCRCSERERQQQQILRHRTVQTSSRSWSSNDSTCLQDKVWL